MDPTRPDAGTNSASAQNEARPATVQDVAREAKVSRATAARALGGYGPVSGVTAQKVFAAARNLNYRTNELARAMRAGKTRTIGLVVADISNSFYDRATRAIIDTAAIYGYQVLVTNTDDDLDTEIAAVRVLTEKRVDGLIVAASSPANHEHLIPGDSFVPPMVLLDRKVPQLNAATISTDDYEGARQAVRSFVDRGHSQIGMLVSAPALLVDSQNEPDSPTSTLRDRVMGFRDGLQQHGVEFCPEWVRYASYPHMNAKAAALKILKQEPRPTAILATNSDMALAILAACNALSLRVRDDVSLICFDDSVWAPIFTPAISVIDRPVYEMGRIAVLGLLSEITSKGVRAESVNLPTSLIDRESVLDLRGGQH